MATPKEIEAQAQLVEVLSRETDGINDVIQSVSNINNFTVVCLCNADLIDNLISQLQYVRGIVGEDPLHEAVLIINSGNEPVLTSTEQPNAVGNHLKSVFLPAALGTKQAQRDIAIDQLKSMSDE